MELVYTGLLLHKAQKEINEENIKNVLVAAGIEKPDGEIKATVAALKDVDIDAAIKEASVAPVAAAPSGGSATGGAPAEKKEEPKEEKKSAEEAAAGLGALFG